MSEETNIKRNLLWAFGERICSKIALFCLQLFLARILVPEDYGLLAILLIFVNIGTILVNSGLSNALIQKNDIDEIDVSSTFFISFIIATATYLVLYFISPFIADFYNDNRIILMLRIISLTLLIGAFNSVQRSLLARQLKFKAIFNINLFGAAISSIVSVIMALKGMGVWSIIIQYMINQAAITLFSAYFIKWWPKWAFDISRVKKLWDFGWRFTLTALISTLTNDIYTAVIGRVYSKRELGEYDTGNKIPQTITDTISSTLSTVLFPTFAKLQNNPDIIKLHVQKINKLSTFLVFPLMFGLGASAYPLILLMLEEKWIGAVPYFQLACILFAFYPLHIANIQAISSRGYADITLKNEIKKKAVELIALSIFIWYGLIYVAIGRVFASFIALYINMEPNKKLLNYPISEQIRDILPNLLIALMSASLTILIGIACRNLALSMRLVLQMLVMVISYLLMSLIFNKVIFSFFVIQVKSIFKR